MSLSIIKSFNFENKELTVYGTVDKPLFLAKEVGEMLELKIFMKI